MIRTLGLIQGTREADRMFRKRNHEGRFIFNNVLMNGHAHMLEYLVENWADAHASLPLTLDSNTSVLHQALAKAAFCRSAEPAHEEEKQPKFVTLEEKKLEAPAATQESFIRMIRALVAVKDKLNGAGICVDS